VRQPGPSSDGEDEERREERDRRQHGPDERSRYNKDRCAAVQAEWRDKIRSWLLYFNNNLAMTHW
jgi:hypothetical protein